MGIQNIHILIDPEPNLYQAQARQRQIQMAQEQLLIEAHRRGEHPWGEKRRACPLCQIGK